MTREEKTIEAMVNIYCREQHGAGSELCSGCNELLDYSKNRLERCRFQERKPTCANCPVHCYRPVMKEKVKDVMRYSGPRMVFRHPVLAVSHFLYGFRKAPSRSKQRDLNR